MILYHYSYVTISNSIFNNISYDDFDIENGSELNIRYSLVANDFPAGQGNIKDDPVFQGVDWLSIRPKIKTAPRIVRPGPVD